MNDKKLTKVQKEILTTLRDNPEARLVMDGFDYTYRLYISGKKIKSLRSESGRFLKPYLEPVKGADWFKGDTVYTFKPGAEISDAWRTQELERQRLERQQKQEEQGRIKEEALQALIGRLKAAFAAIERGEIDNGAVEYDYQARFEYNGKWYSLREGE